MKSRIIPAWYQGGTLHNKTIKEWREASYEDKLATCANFISIEVIKDIRNNPLLVIEITDINYIKPYAEKLVMLIDKFLGNVGDESRTQLDPCAVSDTVITIMRNIGWVKKEIE